MEFDPIETCPYDAVHRIRRSRMQFHITTCSKNFPASKMKPCPFDARHKVNEVEFEYHKSHCPARESVIHYAIHDPESQAEARILPIDVKFVGEMDENWDDDANVKTYNPLQAIQDKPIVYSVIGLSKAKRKEHRMQQRLRISQIYENSGHLSQNQPDMLSNSMDSRSQLNSSLKIVDKKVDEDEEEYKPLRRPFVAAKKGKNVSPKKNEARMPTVLENSQNIPPKDKESPTLRRPKASPINDAKMNDSIIDKLSRTFEEINVNKEDHKKKDQSLDEQINILKKTSSEKKSRATFSSANNSLG